MRAVLHQDVVALARCLMLVPESGRRGFARRKILLADLADRHRRARGRAHPLFGDGTLSAVLTGLPRARQRPMDQALYGSCFQAALAEVLAFRAAHPRAHDPAP